MASLDKKIARLEEQLRKQDERIGREMEKRVTIEEQLAAAYEERNAARVRAVVRPML